MDAVCVAQLEMYRTAKWKETIYSATREQSTISKDLQENGKTFRFANKLTRKQVNTYN